MEHRKEYGSPRDMLDDALLQRILADMTDDTADVRPRCGCGQGGRTDRNTDQKDRIGYGCGCGGNERTAGHDSRTDTGCGCGRNRVMPRQEVQNNSCPVQNRCVSGRGVEQLKGFPLAMVFSPNQEWEGIFEPEEALAKGTLFTGLVFPWYPSRCREGNSCSCGRD